MENFKFAKYTAFALAMGCLASCSDDDTPTTTEPTVDPKDMSFLVTSADPTEDLKGGVRVKLFNDLSDNSRTDQTAYTDESALKSGDAFTQVAWNKETQTFTGFIYGRGATVLGGAGLRSYKVDNDKVVEISEPVKFSNFGNSGTFGVYSYAAQISNPNATVTTRNGDNITSKSIDIDLPKYAIDETNPSISEIIDMGNNQVAMVLNYSNRDSAAVAFCDYNLNIKSVVYDGRIGASVGANRSVRYSQSGIDDNGNVYVFSGNGFKEDKNGSTGVGAVRIKKGETDFDKDYFFDITAKSDGYRFRKAYHISGSYFLLEFFLDKGYPENRASSGKQAVVNMDAKSFTWVDGLPDPSTVSFGWADGYNGIMYLPVAAPTGMNGGGGNGGGGGRPQTSGLNAFISRAESTVTPTIYAIDAATGKATPFMTFKTNELLKAITILK